MTQPLIVLSLGAGVQSSTLALMAAVTDRWGAMPAAAIFADTQAEPVTVYQWLDYLVGQLPFPVRTVTAGNLAEDGLQLRQSRKSGKVYQKNLIPLFVKNPTGTRGLLNRRCTVDYKVRAIQKDIRTLLGKPALKTWGQQFKAEMQAWRAYEAAMKAWRKFRAGSPPAFPTEAWNRMQAAALVEQWIGISRDETQRMKDGSVPYIRNRWPLVEAGITRTDCLTWMATAGHPVPPRSACVFCPYHSDTEWQRLKTEEPAEFQKAAEWEARMQQARSQDQVALGDAFLHETLVPISQVDFAARIAANPQREKLIQFGLFGQECEGMCGV